MSSQGLETAQRSLVPPKRRVNKVLADKLETGELQLKILIFVCSQQRTVRLYG
jgi:hypothetical protein